MSKAATTLKNTFICLSALTILSLTLQVPLLYAEEDIWDDKPAKMPPRYPLTEKAIETILARIAEESPQKAEQLKKLRKEDPQQFRRQIRIELGKMHQGPERPPAVAEKLPPDSETGRPPGERPSRPRGPGRSGGRWRENMQKRHEEFVDWLQKNYPDEAQKLEQLKEQAPDQYMKSAFASMRKYSKIMDAEKRNPELAEVLKDDLETQKLRTELLAELKKADEKERTQLTEELQQLVSRRFDLIVRKKQLQYQELQKRLEKMQAELKERQQEVKKLQETKQQAIKQRLNELLGKSEKLNWE